MKTVNVKIKYDNNDKSISLFFDADSLLLLSDTKKELNAKEIYDMFKYENGKKYILNDLDNYDGISEDNQYYLNECHKIFKNIIDGLEIPEE